MFTHTFAHTQTTTLIDASLALGEFLDSAKEMVSVGDLPGGLFAELSQIEAQIEVVIEQRPDCKKAKCRKGTSA